MAPEVEVVYPPPRAASPVPPVAPDERGLGRLSPQQVLLGAGAVAVVAAGTASVLGASTGQVLLTLLVVGLAGGSVLSGRRALAATEETLAAAAAALAAVGALQTTRSSAGDPVVLLALLCVVFALLSWTARTAATWPVAAWCAAQLAALTALTGLSLPPAGHTAALLGTAVAGLGFTLRARRSVAVVGLVTTTPWWVVGVVQGATLAWTVEGTTAWTAGALMVAAGAELLALDARRDLRRLLGPRAAVPVLSGAVAGTGVAGALQTAGPAGVALTGWAGLAVAAVVAVAASPLPRALSRPAGLSLAVTLTALAVAQLVADGHWSALASLLLVAAVPAVLVAARQPVDRAGALPVSVGCLAGAVLLAEADGTVGNRAAGPLLLVVAVGALGAATWLRRHRSERPLAVSGTAVGVLAVVHVRLVSGAAPGQDAVSPTAVLAVLGVALLAHGTLADRSRARALGSAALVLTAWNAAADAGVTVPEAYTLPAAVALLLSAGRGLAAGASWPSWGPGLVVGFAPSVGLAAAEPALGRLVLVLLAAVASVVLGLAGRARAPFVVGAVSLTAAAVGRLVVSLPAPGQLALVVAGGLLLVAGAVYERARQQAVAAAAHVADLR